MLKQIKIETNQNFLLPVMVSFSIFISPMKLYIGCLKAAGLFFSKKKCPNQENPYPIKKTPTSLMYEKKRRVFINIMRARVVPTICNLLFV